LPPRHDFQPFSPPARAAAITPPPPLMMMARLVSPLPLSAPISPLRYAIFSSPLPSIRRRHCRR
jgi:hypothetical protein